MSKYYFTYGLSDTQPYQGGWTEVALDVQAELDNVGTAIGVFKTFHPDTKNGAINCSSIYTEEEFFKSAMCKDGNFGRKCHEWLSLKREVSA